jgi:WD40 repeat protein
MPRFFEFSTDGQTFMSGGDDGTVRLWDPRTGEGRIAAKYDSAVSLARLSPDSGTIAACDFDLNLTITDLGTGARSRIGDCERWDVKLYPMAYSPAGRYLASGDGHGNVLIWDVAKQRARTLRGGRGMVNDLEFSPNGTLLASAHDDGPTMVFRSDTGEPIETVEHCAYQARFSDNERWLACAGETGTVVLRDLRDGGRWELRGHGAATLGLRFRSGGQGLVSIGLSGDVRTWPLPRATPLVSGFGLAWIQALAYSPDGQSIATGDREGDLHLTTAGTRESRLLRSYETPLFDLDFVSGENAAITIADANGGVHAWDLATQSSRTLGAHGAVAMAVAPSPSGDSFASAGLDGDVRLWDLTTDTGRVVGHRETPTREVAFSPDGTLLATGDAEGAVLLWSTDAGAPRTLTGHSGAIAYVRFSPDGKKLASASWDGTARVWDVGNGASIIVAHHEGEVRDAVWLPDGKHVLTVGGDGNAMLASANGGGEPVILRGHSQPIKAAAISPDGKVAATVSEDGTARVWSLVSGACAVVRGPGRSLEVVSFSPDGSWLAVGGNDGALEQWSLERLVEPPAPRVALRDWLTRASTSATSGEHRHRSP